MSKPKQYDYFEGHLSFSDAVTFWFLKFAGVPIAKIASEWNIDPQTVKDVFAGRIQYGSEIVARRAS